MRAGGHKLEGSQKIAKQAAYLRKLPRDIPELQKRSWIFKKLLFLSIVWLDPGF